ncbi:MAG TPA: hypothetical protein VMW38_18270 [Terriglobia bacterium]|nr:hypothetical protein [Terriglobia bacterium]
MEKVTYYNQPNCFKLSNGTVEVIVTTDIGPRIIRYGFQGEENLLAEVPDLKVTTELGDWKAWGGHRLWAAPESMPRTYSPDNTPIEYKQEGKQTIRLVQPVEPKTGIQKEMAVTLAETGTRLTIYHKITNKNLWAVDLSPWAMTIMKGGGVTILPQEPYRSHDDYLLPARPMVLWHYTNFSDPRWVLGGKYLCLKTDKSKIESQKVGILNKQGWAAYSLNQLLFVKAFDYKEGASYPDYGCNTETYTSASFMEIESLGPLVRLEPGQSTEHVERWILFRGVDVGSTEASLDAAIAPRIAEAAKP